MNTSIFSVPVFSTLCNAAFALRREVFISEQNVPAAEEFDADDLTATHFVAIADGEVVATLRLMFLDQHVKVGRVATKRAYRGMGVGKALLATAMAHAQTLGHERFYLTAQSDKLGFYERLGFVAYGPEFDDGGMPHRAMRTYDKDSAKLLD